MEEIIFKVIVKLRTFSKKLRQLARWPKRTILISHDIILMLFALWLGMSLRLSTFYIPEPVLITQFLLAPLLGVVIFHYLGLYKLVTRYINQRYIFRMTSAVTVSVLAWTLLMIMLQPDRFVPRSVIIMYWLFTILFVISSRLFASWLLQDQPIAVSHDNSIKKNILIYGIGAVGFQLLESLKHGQDYFPVGFIDRDKSVWGQKVFGIKIYSPEKIETIIEQKNIREIFLSLHNLSQKEKSEITRQLQKFPVKIKKLPDIDDITAGKIQVSDLRPIMVEDLLSRKIIPPDQKLLARNNKNRVVMISGAGGSIGSEIAIHVLQERPKTLILFEISEVALYHIDNRLNELARNLYEEDIERDFTKKDSTKPVEIIPVLGSVLDRALIHKILVRYKVEIIYHSAAYKHVPLVEINPVAGLQNNTFGTWVIAQVAKQVGINHFVLISTDKAVRPTNIMGASKRLAELVLQALANEKDTKTIFAIVRFGNVLDSSGSVVKRFTQQIIKGGPVTVTHPDIIRYFMCIPEAAQLVIQAGAMSRGGEIFVLDMGEPVKILELARTMIHLAGLNIKNKDNPEGDIEISFVGLRPGEKLYEELLISKNTSKTEHPRILCNHENFIPINELEEKLKELELQMCVGDIEKIRKILENIVEDYQYSK